MTGAGGGGCLADRGFLPALVLAAARAGGEARSGRVAHVSAGRLGCRYSKSTSAKSAELHRKGRIWLICAGAAIAAYVVLGGQYIQFGFLEDDYEDDDGDE